MRIVVLCEGATEQCLRASLRDFFQRKTGSVGCLANAMRCGLEMRSVGPGGPIRRKKLKTLARTHAEKEDVSGVIALTDVYPEYSSAKDAKNALHKLVGNARWTKKFRAHAAQYELEAWLIPFWDQIASHLRSSMKRPGAKPEDVNDQNPPSKHLKKLYRNKGRDYVKVRDAGRWLTPERLEESAQQCPELKAFLNSLLELAQADPIP